MKKIVSALLISVFSMTAIAADYITNAGEIVSAADWDSMKTIEIRMSEFEYSFDEMELTAGQPYRFVLINDGEKKHYFTAPEFYKSIATRKVQSNKDGEIKAPYFTAIELMVGGELELYFVPVTTGTYDVFCTLKGHRDDGMESTITIM